MLKKQLNIVCTICVRSGSKSIKRKGLKKINNKSLFQITLEQSIKSNIFNSILISSDDEKIINISKKYSVDFIYNRPKNLSGDKVPKIDVIKNLIRNYQNFDKHQKIDLVVDLDVTVPSRDIKDIKGAINLIKKNKNSTNLIAITKAKKNPYFNMIEFKNKKISLCKKTINTSSRQTVPKVYEVSSSFYIWKISNLLKSKKILNKNTIAYEIPYIRSIDIDNEVDLFLMKKVMN